MKTIRLRDGKERSLLRRHPWVFEGSVDKGGADSGETVRVQASDGRFLAWGAYSPRSSIRVRAWSFDEGERIDSAFFERRLAAALAMRARLGIASDGVRLVHGEADGLPGLIVDRYGDNLVLQTLTLAMDQRKLTIVEALRDVFCRASAPLAATLQKGCRDSCFRINTKITNWSTDSFPRYTPYPQTDSPPISSL